MDLTAIAKIVEDTIKESLNEKVYVFGRYQKGTTNKVASGKLRNSIKATVVDNKQGIEVIKVTGIGGKPLMNTYAYWLVEGRKPGKWANINAIKEWIMNKKSFKIRDFKTGQFLPKTEKNVDSVAFVIARSIGRWGFQNKPKNFITVAMDKLINNQEIVKYLEEETFDELMNSIEGI